MKSLVSGMALAVLTAGVAQAATRPVAAPWIVQPAEASCRVELELSGHSGAVTPVTLVSDGDQLVLRFAKDDLPERAFLPIRVDQKPYANIMRRTADPAVGELTLSDAAQAAMRKGKTLSVAWLSDEPVSVVLGGSEQGVPDLKTCGAQVAGEARARAAAADVERVRADAEARERAVTEAQLKAAEAQAAVAEAERERLAQAAQRERAEAQRAEAEARRIQIDAEQRQRLAYQAEQQRAYQDDQASYEEERQRAYEEALRRYRMQQQLALPPAPQPYYPPGRAYGRRF